MSMERNEASQGSRPALSTTQQHERFEYMGELCWEGGLPSWTPFQGAASNIYTTVHVATPRHAAEEEEQARKKEAWWWPFYERTKRDRAHS